MKKSMGDRLIELRERLDLNQVDVSVATGIGRPYLSTIENDKKEGRLATIAALADFYNVSIDYLYRGTPVRPIKDGEDIAHGLEEVRLLKIWRALDEAQRQSLMDGLLNELIAKSNAA